MFRELVRKNRQLSNESCIELLKTETRGVLSVLGDDDYPYGMPMNFWYKVKSVIIFGKIEIIDDMEQITDIVTKLSYRFIQDDEYIKEEIRLHGHRTLLMKLAPEHMCGKLVTES